MSAADRTHPMYDPGDPIYVDQPSVRAELTRTFDVCQTCRRCADLCSSFPTLFSLIDRTSDRDAGRLTPADQDRVIDQCHQCTLCSVECPHGPALESPGVDVPRLMNRARAMHRANNLVPVRVRLAASSAARAGFVGTMTRPLADRVANAQPGSTVRKIASTVAAVAPERLLPPVSKIRFSTWFRTRGAPPVVAPQRSVAIYPSCLVEHSDPTIGHDVVKVYERNDIACSVADVGCCGAPLLHTGDVRRFIDRAEKIVRTLALAVRSGDDIVVPQATCSHILKHEFPRHLRSSASAEDADAVAERVSDAAGYLEQLHRSTDGVLDTDFVDDVPVNVTLHGPCHLRGQGLGSAGRDLLELTGSAVSVVEQCSGAAGLWGVRTEHENESNHLADRMYQQLQAQSSGVVAGSCHLANLAIATQTGETVHHPLQVLARAYGIESER